MVIEVIQRRQSRFRVVVFDLDKNTSKTFSLSNHTDKELEDIVELLQLPFKKDK